MCEGSRNHTTADTGWLYSRCGPDTASHLRLRVECCVLCLLPRAESTCTCGSLQQKVQYRHFTCYSGHIGIQFAMSIAMPHVARRELALPHVSRLASSSPRAQASWPTTVSPSLSTQTSDVWNVPLGSLPSVSWSRPSTSACLFVEQRLHVSSAIREFSSW